MKKKKLLIVLSTLLCGIFAGIEAALLERVAPKNCEYYALTNGSSTLLIPSGLTGLVSCLQSIYYDGFKPTLKEKFSEQLRKELKNIGLHEEELEVAEIKLGSDSILASIDLSALRSILMEAQLAKDGQDPEAVTPT